MGSHKNTQGKIFIEAQAWALVCRRGRLSPRGADAQSCDKLLLTDLGYALLSPTFTKLDDRVGRISCLEPGTCENGTIYSHTNAWMVLGLLKCGRTEEAYELLKRITPGLHHRQGQRPQGQLPALHLRQLLLRRDHRYNKFQMEFTWITGSVAWSTTCCCSTCSAPGRNSAACASTRDCRPTGKQCQVERQFPRRNLSDQHSQPASRGWRPGTDITGWPADRGQPAAGHW